MIGKRPYAALGVLYCVLMPCISGAQNFALDSTKGLQPHDVKVEELFV